MSVTLAPNSVGYRGWCYRSVKRTRIPFVEESDPVVHPTDGRPISLPRPHRGRLRSENFLTEIRT